MGIISWCSTATAGQTEDCQMLQGRFTLRDEGRTIAIGKIIKLPSHRNAQTRY